MLYLLLYALYFLAPGWLILRLVPRSANHFLLIFSLSYVFLIVMSVLAMVFGLDPSGFTLLLNGMLLLLVVLVAVTRGRSVVAEVAGSVMRIRTHRLRYAIPLSTLVLMLAYLAAVGPYTEIPSDAWWHLGEMQNRAELLDRGILFGGGDTLSFSTWSSKNVGYWYTLHAYLCHLAGIAVKDSIVWVTLANSIVFAASVFAFSLAIFKGFRLSTVTKYLIAAATVAFYALHFGIAQFAFLRYYVLAPAFLNYVLFLTTIWLYLRFLQDRATLITVLIPIPFLLLVMAVVHKQEALLSMTMFGLLAIVAFIKQHKDGVVRWLWGSVPRPSNAALVRSRVNVTLIVFLFVYIVFHGYLYVTVMRQLPLKYETMTPISTIVPFLSNLYILKPTYQFYQVVTAWGIFVYLMFAWQWRVLSRSLFLLTGMLSPLLTVFNPVYTDLFLRLAPASVLWRLCLMIPLPLVAGYCLIAIFGKGRDAIAGSVVAKAVAVAGLLVLLFPIQSTFFSSQYSRLATVAAVKAGNDYVIWDDLRIYLDALEPREVITDQVTGYMINGLTSHHYAGYKFYGFRAIKLERKRFNRRTFRNKEGSLLIINKRDGETSLTGRISRHWPENIMQVSRFYSAEFEQFIRENTNLFRLLWEQDRIRVYEIHESM